MREVIHKGEELTVANKTKGKGFTVNHLLSERQVKMILEGGLINVFRKKFKKAC